MCAIYFKFKSLLLECLDHGATGGSVYRHLTGSLSQNAPSLTTLSCETEHLLPVRVIHIF